MRALLRLSRLIDTLTDGVGKAASWLILLAVLISAGNALARYAFNASSNAWLEIQWYLFAAAFLLCAGYALKHNQHVRVDVLSSRLSRRAQAWIEIFGSVLFLLPMALLVLWLSWPVFVDSWRSGEVSTNADGLVLWPARLLVPAGFALLVLQGLSEVVKRAAFLLGAAPDPGEKPEGPAGREFADAILKSRQP
ncbi:MAG: TRAP transporter small permease subunit [Gammaproteobacteria bacterium]